MWQRPIHNTILTVLVCLFAMAVCANGKTIYVDDDAPADFNNIQAAIDDSNDGDTIVVADGLYMEGDEWSSYRVADFRGKAITLRSESGPDNCILHGDYAAYFHEGEGHTSVLSGFTISGAWTAAILCEDSSPTIMNNIITDNPLDTGWGAITLDNSSALIIGNIIADNCGEGYSIECHGSASVPIIANNTIVDKCLPGILCESASPVITNCIIWDSGYQRNLTNREATYCCLDYPEGGVGNIYADPMFVDYENGDFHLLPGSPCIDAGSDAALHPLLLTDLDGNPRISDMAVDIGVYETQQREFLLSEIRLEVPEGGTETLTLALARDPLGPVVVTIAKYLGDQDINVASGVTLNFDSSDYSEPKTVVFSAAEDGDYLSNMAVFWISAPGYETAGIRATEQDNDVAPAILRVDADAAGLGSGQNWADAFADLQEALRNAREFAQLVKEIRVAQGVYRPGGPSDGRQATFELIDGISIKGGYAGFGEANPDARDIGRYETILSGDLNTDDAEVTTPSNLWEEPSRAENSRHVVVASHTERRASLDGFTITGGNADRHGGGVFCDNADPEIANCTFEFNTARLDGGGMCISEGSRPTLVNCKFEFNSARYGGGAVLNDEYASVEFVECEFRGNVGGVFSNWVGAYAGFMNCLFTRNSAEYGPVVGNGSHADLVMTNCTVTDNTGGISAGTWYYTTRPVITNSIIWRNPNTTAGESSQIRGGEPVINYSCIQGWTGDLGGTGNAGADPLFAEPDSGDYHLKSQAGRWDVNEGRWVIDEVTSPCIDAGDPMSPIGYEPFPNGGIVNMGAYGGTAEASKSYFRKPPCETIVAGDINGDCEVDFSDLSIMALHWCEDHNL